MESNHIQLNVETINNLIEDINKVSAKLGAMCFYCNKVINDDEKDIIHTMKHIEGDYQPVIFHKVCYDTQGIKRCKVCDTLMRGKKFIGMKYCSLDCKHTMLKKIDGERKAFLENDFNHYEDTLIKMFFKKYYDEKGTAYYVSIKEINVKDVLEGKNGSKEEIKSENK